jgi:hypothetical protein
MLKRTNSLIYVYASLLLFAAAAGCSQEGLAPSSPTSPSSIVAAKPGGDELWPADLTFADRSGDAITSDGLGAYVHSDGGGYESAFHSSTGDFVLRGSDGGRIVNVDFTNRLTGSGPVGAVADDRPFIRVAAIRDLQVGASQSAVAVFSSLPGGQTPGKFWFNPNKHGDSIRVAVVRNDTCTWTVTADPGVDVAALEQSAKGNKTTVVGTYAMPFQMTIVLQGCSAS